YYSCLFFFSSRRRHTRSKRDWSSDVCSSDLDRSVTNPATGWITVGHAVTSSKRQSKPRWKRRKDARPGEIVAAALEVFGERGFRSEERRVGKGCGCGRWVWRCRDKNNER